MTNAEEKKRWKDEANQLRKDLASRPKHIKKNEVPIQFNTSPKKSDPLKKVKKSKPSNTESTKLDDHLRSTLGL